MSSASAPSPHTHSTSVRLGGAAATVVFVLMLFAFVIESEITQYVQTTLGYRQPFFLFYIVHSSFAVVFPLHLVYLKCTSATPIRAYLNGLWSAFKIHFSKSAEKRVATDGVEDNDLDAPFPFAKLLRLIAWLTLGVSLPALLWFAAITLASISDVTALWNSNVFWAYVITVRMHHTPWRSSPLIAALMASIGAAIVVYGSQNPPPLTDDPNGFIISREDSGSPPQPKAPLIGNLLTLLASVIYAFYQVGYKEYAALENDPVPILDDYERLPANAVFDESTEVPSLNSPIAYADTSAAELPAENDNHSVYPPPFGFHPDFLISSIGVCTFSVLWILLPIFHYTDVESFRLPPDLWTLACIAAVAVTGIMFNASFMILLGVWGPIVTSVGNLLTIVLVLVSDVVLIGAATSLTFWRLLGSGMIVCSFALLAYDTS